MTKIKDKSIVSGEQITENCSLRKKLVGMDKGLSVYCSLDKDEEDIKIPFTISLFVTSEKARQLTQVYLDNLGRDECWEVLGNCIGQMSNMDYWQMRLSILQCDMENWGSTTLKEHGYDCTIMGFRPKTTTDLFRAIETNVKALASLLGQVQQMLKTAPPALYGYFYRHQRTQYCEAQAVNDFDDWLMHSGIITSDKLRSLQAKTIAEFVNSGILRCCIASSDIERSQVDIEAFKRMMPGKFHYEEWFDNAYTIFNRTIGWQGDIIIPNYNCAGLFIFQHWDELSQEQVYSIFYLDKMLELIREMMQRLPATECHPACGHPTPERDMNLENRIKKCISLLMAERYGDEPLFNIQGHWQAVYRILVDKGYCRDSDFDGFDTFIQRVMPDKVNKPYKKDSVKSISQTDFALPFERWHYDPQTSTTRKPYDRMVSIAIRFKQILEEKGL